MQGDRRLEEHFDSEDLQRLSKAQEADRLRRRQAREAAWDEGHKAFLEHIDRVRRARTRDEIRHVVEDIVHDTRLDAANRRDRRTGIISNEWLRRLRRDCYWKTQSILRSERLRQSLK